jgi:hypothetical protein
MAEIELTNEQVQENLAQSGLQMVEEPEVVVEGYNPPEKNVQQETQETLAKETQVENERRDREYNMRRIREEKEAIERENYEIKRRLAELERSTKNEVVEEDNDGLVDTDLVEARHFKAYKKDARELKKENAEIKQRLEEQAMQLQVRSEMPDFYKVVNEETVAELYKKNPRLAVALEKTPNGFDKMAAIYDAVKALPKDQFVAEKKAVQEAAQRPRAAATLAPQTGNTPLDNANAFASGMTDEQKKALWDEMNNYANF